MLIGLLLLGKGWSCGTLCLICDLDWQQTCRICVSNAEKWTTSSCTCSSGYRPTPGFDGCDKVTTGVEIWVWFLVGLGAFLLICAILACRHRLAAERNARAYRQLGEPVIMPVAVQPAQPRMARISASPVSLPTAINSDGSVYASNPYNTVTDSSTSNSNAAMNEDACPICKLGNCDWRTSCGHMSHRRCLDMWRQETCPKCGRYIPELQSP